MPWAYFGSSRRSSLPARQQAAKNGTDCFFYIFFYFRCRAGRLDILLYVNNTNFYLLTDSNNFKIQRFQIAGEAENNSKVRTQKSKLKRSLACNAKKPCLQCKTNLIAEQTRLLFKLCAQPAETGAAAVLFHKHFLHCAVGFLHDVHTALSAALTHAADAEPS